MKHAGIISAYETEASYPSEPDLTLVLSPVVTTPRQQDERSTRYVGERLLMCPLLDCEC